MSESRAVANEHEGYKRTLDNFQQFLNDCRHQRVNGISENELNSTKNYFSNMIGRAIDTVYKFIIVDNFQQFLNDCRHQRVNGISENELNSTKNYFSNMIGRAIDTVYKFIMNCFRHFSINFV